MYPLHTVCHIVVSYHDDAYIEIRSYCPAGECTLPAIIDARAIYSGLHRGCIVFLGAFFLCIHFHIIPTQNGGKSLGGA